MEERYLIIADDFIGADDTGVQLKGGGYPTEVLFAGRSMGSQKSIVIDTKNRNTLPGHAYEIVRHSLEQVDLGQLCYTIKRVGSIMRGNISQEIKVVDDAFRPDLVAFVPALPALRRTTTDGVQCLNGAEICEAESSKDPKNPMMKDSPVKLLEQVYEEPIQLKYLPDVRNQSFFSDRGRVFVHDVGLDDDLKRVAAVARQDGRRTLHVGTAEMADNLMKLGKPALPPFGVVASVGSMANEQVRYYERVGYATIKAPIARIMMRTVRPKDYRNMAVEYLKSRRNTILLTDTAYDRELIELSQEAGEKNGMDLTEAGGYVRSLIGRMARRVLDSTAASGAYLTGGDTTLEMLMSIGTDGSEILAETLVGVPLVRAKSGAHEGLKLITEARAFGTEDAAAFAMGKAKERGGI